MGKALEAAADALWKRLDPRDEIAGMGIIPNRFNEAAELAILAFLRAALEDEDIVTTEDDGTKPMQYAIQALIDEVEK